MVVSTAVPDEANGLVEVLLDLLARRVTDDELQEARSKHTQKR